MKIEWTDKACEAARDVWYNTPYTQRSWRDALNAATAEQFRPETIEEKCKRYEDVMRETVRKIHAKAAGLTTVRLELEAALAHKAPAAVQKELCPCHPKEI